MSQSFRDTVGRPWLLGVTVADVKRVRRLTGVDLFTLFDDEMAGWQKLTGDVCLFVDVLFALVMDQAAAAKPPVSDEDFGRALGGDVLTDAHDAFAEALLLFFPNPNQRKALADVVSKGKRLETLLGERMVRAAAEIDPEKALAEIERLAEASNRASTPSPASLASTPTPSPSAS